MCADRACRSRSVGLVGLFDVATLWGIDPYRTDFGQTLALWGSAICGTALGLVVSAIARTQERAVGVIPLLMTISSYMIVE